MKTRGQFSKPTPFNYQSHQSLQKFRKVPIQQRAQDITQDIFKIKVKGQPTSKLIVARNSAGSKQQQNKQLKKHIKLLQNQLKRKILQNPILSKIFKTKQLTNNELSHIDLYIQFIKLKQQQEQSQKKVEETIEEYKKKQMQYQLQIAQLKEQKEKRQQEFITEIQKATLKFQQIKKDFNKKILEKEKIFQEQTIQRQSKIQDHSLLLEEFKRKNSKLTKQLKQLQLKLSQCKRSEQQKQKHFKVQHQTLKQKYQSQQNQLKEQLQKIKLNNKKQLQAKQKRITNLQNQIADKTLQIQQFNRFIELQKQSYQNKMLQQKQAYQQEIYELNIKHEELMNKQSQKIQRLQESNQCQTKQIVKKYEAKIQKLKKQLQQKINQLEQTKINKQNQLNQASSSIKQKQKIVKTLQEEIKIIKTQFQSQNNQLKQFNKQIIDQKQSLIKKLSSTQQKLQKNTKQLQHILYQRNELHSKYQKGYLNTQNDIKHYQSIIQELQRKIYFIGNQNMGLKKCLQEKSSVQNKVKQMDRLNEQKYQEKYKAIGRIQEIKHKLQNYLMNDIGKSGFNFIGSNFANCINTNVNNYRSNSSQNSISLLEALQGLTFALDRFFDNYSSLSQSIQTIKKQKIQDQREIQSILNHFLDIEERQEELVQNIISYINVRKQLTKQISSSELHCGEQYLHEKKRQLSQSIIQKLIQIKVIKQYSSADQGISSYRVAKSDKFNQPRSAYDSIQSTKQLSSTTNFKNNRNSKKNMKALIEQDQQQRLNQQNFDNEQRQFDRQSLRKSHKKVLFQIDGRKLTKERKSSLAKSKQNSRVSLVKNSQVNRKYRSRISTQPTCSDEDIDQQSTYQIQDQNINYGNFNKQNQCNNNIQNLIQNKKSYNPSLYSTKTKNQQKLDQKKKYKDIIKQKLLNPRNYRQKEANSGLSKQDIQKKYFLR